MPHTSLDQMVFAAVTEVFDTASAQDQQAIFLDLKRRYNESGRFFHNFARVAKLIQETDKHEWDDRKAGLASLLYMDVIHNPLDTIHAFSSAEYAADQLNKYGQSGIAPTTHSYILATVDHRPTQVLSADILRVCDIDRVEWGHVDFQIYSANAVNIVAEGIYACYENESDTARGLSVARAREHAMGDTLAILKAGGTIFKTAPYADFNAVVRDNIHQELAISQSHIWPRAVQLATSIKTLKIDNAFPHKPAFA